MISVFGGEVVFAGEILHGKTSALHHDGKGVYRGLAQGIPVTRYHSLAGTHASLPSSLVLSSWTSNDQGQEGVIMGVRHKDYTVEGVQFHPESILTQDGRVMFRNFLCLSGGKWKRSDCTDEPGAGAVVEESPVKRRLPPKSSRSKLNGASATKKVGLEEIFIARKQSVQEQQRIPSQTMADFEEALQLGLAPPLIDFVQRLRDSPFPLALMAEIKRGSPSKGVISISARAPSIARTYALAGASVISVLTEPKWFRGSIDDLRAVSKELQCMPNRPAILRKEFVFSDYQILEARLAGADTVLLIVKMLSREALKALMTYSRNLGMEPLVEVNTAEEMETAVSLGALVIGINNRDLTSFEVDLGTTTRLLANVPQGTIICALSGISGAQDIKPYLDSPVGAILVGEAMMLAPDVNAFVQNLMGISAGLHQNPTRRLVKICGTRTTQAARVAVEAGADLIGMILVQGRKRSVNDETALKISKVVHETPRYASKPPSCGVPLLDPSISNYFDLNARWGLYNPDRALLVGVFQDQPLEFVLKQQQALRLDVVQLHGSEPAEWATIIPCPVLKSFDPGEFELHQRGLHALPLLDSGKGGTGSLVNLEVVRRELRSNPSLRICLAGGLTAPNVASILETLKPLDDQVIALDVSSGLEKDGVQDHDAIISFINAVREVERTV